MKAPNYETPSRLASCLEMEWSDWLLFPSNEAVKGSLRPPRGPVLPSFYFNLIQFLVRHGIPFRHENMKVCDVGGATGRVLYEWLKLAPKTQEAMLVESSDTLCEWARHLLLGDASIPFIPMVRFFDLPEAVRPARIPPAVSTFSAASVFVECVDANSVPRPNDYFDVVTCLNVVDRVLVIEELLSSLHRIVKPKGFLILAAPMDWLVNRDLSPESQNKLRIENLRELLPPDQWKVVDETELDYELRATARCSIRYTSQVLCAVKLPHSMVSSG